VSVALHAANTVLLFWVLLAITGGRNSKFETRNSKQIPNPKPEGVSSAEARVTQLSTINYQPSTIWRCAFVAALFGLHPMHVESVAWASERKDVLSAFFFFLTLWAYAAYVQRKFETRNSKLEGRSNIQQPPSRITHHASRITHHASRFTHHVSRITHHASFFYFLSLALFALGLMTKPMLVTTPFVLLLLDYWPLRRCHPSTLGPPLSTVSTLVLEKVPFFALSIGASIVTVLAQKQSGYVVSVATLPFDTRLINAAVSYTGYLKKLFWPVHLTLYYPLNTDLPIEYGFAAAFLILLISVVAFAWLRARPYCFVGWFWFLGTLIPVIGLLQVGLQSMADRYSYIASIGLFIAIIWLCSDLVFKLRLSPSPPVELRTKSRWKISPTGVGERRPLQDTLPSRGPWSRGLWSRCPWSVVLWSLSLSLLIACAILTELQIGFWKNNETLYRHTLKITPDNPLIIGNLGCALVEAGRYKEATDYFEAALKGYPGSAEAQVGWGVGLEMQGRNEEAINHYRRAIELNPRLERPHYSLANSLVAQGKRPEAAQEYEIALQIDPESAPAANDLAWILATAPEPDLRNGQRAVALAELACRLTNFSEPLFLGTLAAAYAEAGQFDKAVETATQAEEKARAMGDKSLADKNAELRELYQKRRPYHERPLP
jgi:Flp pilus assembly protein TadD